MIRMCRAEAQRGRVWQLSLHCRLACSFPYIADWLADYIADWLADQDAGISLRMVALIWQAGLKLKMRTMLSDAGLGPSAVVEAFGQFDEDGDGMITATEFVKMCRNKLHIKLPKPELLKLWGLIDVDKDGSIEIVEFAEVAILVERLPYREGRHVGRRD